MAKKTYCFKVGDKTIKIEASTQQEAFRLLGVCHWHDIQINKTVELMGEEAQR